MNYRPYYIVRNFDNLPSSKATTLGSFLALSLACYLAFFGNYSGRHHLDATNKMILYPLPHKSIEKKFFLLDSD